MSISRITPMNAKTMQVLPKIPISAKFIPIKMHPATKKAIKMQPVTKKGVKMAQVKSHRIIPKPVISGRRSPKPVVRKGRIPEPGIIRRTAGIDRLPLMLEEKESFFDENKSWLIPAGASLGVLSLLGLMGVFKTKKRRK